MTLLKTNADDGSKSIDWNRVVELGYKIASIVGIIVGVWAAKQSGTAQNKAEQVEVKTAHVEQAVASNTIAVAAVSNKVEQADSKAEDAAASAEEAASDAAVVKQKVEITASAVVQQKAALVYLGGTDIVEVANAPAPIPEPKPEQPTEVAP